MLAKAADKYLSGKTPFTVNVTVGPKVTVNVKSSLSGLESKLPPPMEKPASLSAPLDLNIVTDNKATDLRLMIDGFLSSEFILQNNDIKRAAIGNPQSADIAASRLCDLLEGAAGFGEGLAGGL